VCLACCNQRPQTVITDLFSYHLYWLSSRNQCMRSSVLLDLLAVPALWGARRNRSNAKPRQGLGRASAWPRNRVNLHCQRTTIALRLAVLRGIIQFNFRFVLLPSHLKLSWSRHPVLLFLTTTDLHSHIHHLHLLTYNITNSNSHNGQDTRR
jgi:hypothetical protein